MKSYFILYANCIVTKGSQRAIIADLQNSCYIFISNSFAEILMDLKKMSIQEFCRSNPNIEKTDLINELNKLKNENLGHYTDELNSFPEICTDFFTPYSIHDCIIEFSAHNYIHRQRITNGLSVLGCQALELRSYECSDLKEIEVFISELTFTRLRSVEIFIKYDERIHAQTYINFALKFPIIISLFVHNCRNEEILKIEDGKTFFLKESIGSSKCCGNISKEFFKINLSFYLEALKHNTCLSRKVSIDYLGNIKNCPSMKKNFGNIEDLTLEQVIENNRSFKELWAINKDQIAVCKSCEFRYICSDCRAFVENPMDTSSKPLKCGYNPITTEWEDWEMSSFKKETIKFYELDTVEKQFI
jgi:SPASM domain peptide maturase of grasp-with-spasm system